MLYLANELDYLSTETGNKLFQLCLEISELISGLIKTFNFMNFQLYNFINFS